MRCGDFYTIGQIAGCRCFPAHYGVTIVLIRGRFDGLTHGEYLKGTRVGEAKNPGPEAHRYRLMITNPTHLYTRLDEVMSCKADTVCLAETASTSDAQISIRSQLSSTGFKAFWGAPAPVTVPHHAQGRANMRGGACGVAVISKSVCRPFAWQNEEPDLVKAARMMRCMVRMGPFTVQVVVVYGACSGAGKQQVNEQLLSDAWMWVKSYQGMSIVTGDFNTPPQGLQSFAPFQQAGFHEFFEYYELSRNVRLPPTCNGVTRNDTCIVPSRLLPYISVAEVRHDNRIANHTPLCIDFNFAQEDVDNVIWSMPQNWADLQLNQAVLAAAYEQVSQEQDLQSAFQDRSISTEQCLRQWSEAVEEAVARVYRETRHFPLPNTYRGRCTYDVMKFEEKKQVAKQAWDGGYDPTYECYTVLSRQRTRQVRRIQTLLNMRKQWDAQGWNQHTSYTAWIHIQNQWAAIQKASGYGRSWTAWLAKEGGIPAFYAEAPPVIFLEQIYKVTKADADHLLRQHFKARNAHVCQADAIDVRANGLKKHFHRIQGEGNPPIQWLNRNVNVQGRMIRAPKGRARIRLQECIALAEGTEATFGEARIAVQAVKAQDVDVTVISGALPTSGTFRTHQIITDVDELGEEFQSFWGQIWNRDRADTTWEDQEWDQARTLVAECGRPGPKYRSTGMILTCGELF